MPEADTQREHAGAANLPPSELVREGVEDIRKRLLDLTPRSRLISFHHTKSSLRIVGADPDSVYRSLLDGRKVPFVCVPEPAGPYTPESGKKPEATQHAEEIGWATSYDLPKRTGCELATVEEQMASLRVLYYEEDFDAIVRKIGTKAKTAIEESGTNILHLVLGFLEWRESDDSTIVHRAPLVVVPVSLITPKQKEADRSVRLQYTGEELTTNLSLVEKLRRDFGLDMPYIEERETPARYFERFVSILDRKRCWRIVRQISLGLLSFSKLLMYLDLDTRRWPTRAPLDEHPRLIDMFAGKAAEGLSFAAEYDIDEEAETRGVPILVCDADSSQHSALVDVSRGANLVIEGPPGTGKSQTITNLIAESIGSGKSVLFVAAKLAALEVVKRRLDFCGLGDFCLELHSNKTSKADVLRSLEARIQASNTYSSPTTLGQERILRDNRRVELTKYASSINAPYGAIGKTPFELIWQRDALREEVPTAIRALNAISFPEAHAWDYKALSEREGLVLTYAAHLRRMFEAGGTVVKKDDHWGWLPDSELSVVDQERLLSALPVLESQYSVRIALVEELRRELPCEGSINEWLVTADRCLFEQTVGGEADADSSNWLSRMSQQPDCPFGGECAYDLLGALAESGQYDAVAAFLTAGERYRAAVSCLSGGAALLTSNFPDEFLRQDRKLRDLGLADYSICGLRSLEKNLSGLEDRVASAKEAVNELAEALGVRAPFTVRCVNNLVTAHRLLSTAPLDLAHLRGPEFIRDGFTHLLERGKRECAALLAEKERLSEYLIFDSQAEPTEIFRAADTLDNTPWYGRLGRAYRDAEAFYRSHSLTVRGQTRRQRAACLRLLGGSQAKMNTFSTSPEYCSHLGERFSGMATPWDDLLLAARWHTEVFTNLPEHEAFASEVRSALLTLPAVRLRSVLAASSGIAPPLQELEGLLGLLRDLSSCLPSLKSAGIDDEISALLEKLRVIVSVSAELLAALRFANLKESTSRDEIMQLIGSVETIRAVRDSLNDNCTVSAILGDYYQGAETYAVPIARALSIVQNMQNLNLPAELRTWLLSPDFLLRYAKLRHWAKDIIANAAAVSAAEQGIGEALHLKCRLGDRTSAEGLQTAVGLIKRCRAAAALLPIRVDLVRVARQLHRAGLSYLVTLCLDGALQGDSLPSTFKYLFCDSLLRGLSVDNPGLSRLSGVTHEEARSQFAQLDRSVINLNRLEVRYRASRRSVPPGVRGSAVGESTELALVQHEITKQRAHIPIRQLMLRAGRSIQALKPCFMMSPMSVAQFLPPGRLTFDLVVMDEASQLHPEDALGPIARGTQLVIVGDPKQLPPSSFFQRTIEDEADEESERSEVAEGESILDIALNRYQPARRLRWHYRSQHHSLIQFSNSEFYDNRLVIFPSAYRDSDALGVKYIDVAGVYENRRNPLEAERVVDAILEHIKFSPSESLGVVTMNFEQRELIEEVLENKLKQDSCSREWMEARDNTPEPFFIRNLENVQGNERDVIFISVTYGPDPHGSYFQRFSGVNSQSGHRRLNVLITRAKKRTVVFSSLDPDMIRSDPGTPWGVRALKGYLQFAKSGISAAPEISPGAEPSNAQEAAVGSVLKAYGYDVVPQVGVSGYFIDLAVRHPKKPGAFLLGIEFDGKSYHSGRSARDRDRLRQMALENQGWVIYRIWSTDWFKNRNAEVDRLLKRVRALDF